MMNPRHRSARIARRLVATLAALAPGCAKPRDGSAAVVRLLDPAHAAMVEVAGEARLAVRVAAGEVLRCEVRLPAEPCWLDVEAATLGLEPGHVLDGTLLDVERVAGERRTTLVHAIADTGTKPTAFGWGHARIECKDHLGETVAFEFRVGAAPDAQGKASGFALSLPRLTPRADARDRGWIFVDWLAAGPSSEELDASGASQRWPGHRRLLAASDAVEVARAIAGGGGARRRVEGSASVSAAAKSTVELEAFGSEDPDDAREPERRVFDRFARVDPLARDADDPALRALAGVDVKLRADRARALGERTLQIDLTQPRRTALAVEVTSQRDGAACDAALSHLIDYLVVNQRVDRMLLLVRTRPAGGARGLVLARLPAGWREHAPADLVARFDERAPELAKR